MTLRAVRTALTACTLLAAAAAATAAQARPPIEPLPALDHWTRAALRRSAGMGAVDAAAALAVWPLAGERVRMLLDSAASHDRLASVLRDRLADERPRDTPWAMLEAGVSGHADRLRAGRLVATPDGPAYTGPRPINDRTAFAWRASAAGRLGNHLLLGLELRDTAAADPALHAIHAAVRTGPVAVRLGRQPFSFGAAHGGGLVLHSPAPFDGLSIVVDDGFLLPGFLRALGPVRFAQLVARMDRSGDIDDPWFAATRITLSPAPPLAIGLQRAILLGGDGNEPITTRRVLLALIGLTDTAGKDSDFENQVASIDVFWKLPGAPASIHVEWATDDTGRAFYRVPAFIAGADWHALPFAPALGTGIELVVMTPPVRQYPPWYRHLGLGDGWTDDGHPLGHPLGGHGREVALTIHAGRARGAVEARMFSRDRGVANLFAPDREGTSLGTRVDGTVRLYGPLHARVRLDAERHARAGWSWSAALYGAVRAPFVTTPR